jgi:hypothetical protein
MLRINFKKPTINDRTVHKARLHFTNKVIKNKFNDRTIDKLTANKAALILQRRHQRHNGIRACR